MAESHDIVSDPFTVTFIRIKACQLCRRCDFSTSDFEDLQQGMRLYLLEKAHLFDPARGNLEAFVTKVLSTWVAMELRYRSRDKRRDSHKVLSLERTMVECEGDITMLGNVLLEEDAHRFTQTQPITELEHFELREALEHAMPHVEPQDKAMLIHVAEHGVASAAKAFGVSRRQVDNAMARIRGHFQKAGLGQD
jgi:RNA polymerase sigma factor (sigma-70 family)